ASATSRRSEDQSRLRRPDRPATGASCVPLCIVGTEPYLGLSMTASERRAIIDLHSHSTASDGVFAPARLVEEAASRGVTTLALTDHDTVAGLDEAEAAARTHGIELLPGVEFTVGCAGTEVHLLGLGVDRTSRPLIAL